MIARTIFEVGRFEDFTPRAAQEPTAARPGSAAKVAVLALRAERGEELWHPGDNQTPPEPPIVFTSLPGIREWVVANL